MRLWLYDGLHVCVEDQREDHHVGAEQQPVREGRSTYWDRDAETDQISISLR